MNGWHMVYGSWWAIQWQWNGWLSLGIHVDWRCRRRADGRRYGPYADLHLACIILSVGRWPIYSGDLDQACSVSRGGLCGDGE